MGLHGESGRRCNFLGINCLPRTGSLEDDYSVLKALQWLSFGGYLELVQLILRGTSIPKLISMDQGLGMTIACGASTHYEVLMVIFDRNKVCRGKQSLHWMSRSSSRDDSVVNLVEHS